MPSGLALIRCNSSTQCSFSQGNLTRCICISHVGHGRLPSSLTWAHHNPFRLLEVSTDVEYAMRLRACWMSQAPVSAMLAMKPEAQSQLAASHLILGDTVGGAGLRRFSGPNQESFKSSSDSWTLHNWPALVNDDGRTSYLGLSICGVGRPVGSDSSCARDGSNGEASPRRSKWDLMTRVSRATNAAMLRDFVPRFISGHGMRNSGHSPCYILYRSDDCEASDAKKPQRQWDV